MSETDRPGSTLLHAVQGLALHLTPGEGAAGLVVLAPDASGLAWAGRMAARLGRPALVVQATDGGFPAPAIEALLPQLIVAAAAERILVGLGSGAVAALEHAAAIDASGVLAVAPQVAGSAALRAFAPGCTAIVAFDPRAVEQAAMAEALTANGAVVPVPMPHAAGGLANVLLAGGALPDAFAALLAGDAALAAMSLRVARLAAPRMRARLVARLAASGHARLAEAVGASGRRPVGMEPRTDARVRALQRLGRHDDAVAQIGAWVRRQPRHALPRRRLAASNLALGQRLRAAVTLKAAAGLGPLPFALHERLVRMLLRLRRQDEAVQAAEAALAALPGEAAAEALLGEALLASGVKDAAVAAFARALAADPGHAGARRGISVAGDPGGRDDAPGPALVALFASMTTAADADWHALVDLLVAQDRPVAARVATIAAVEAMSTPALLCRLAQLHQAAGDAAGAEAAWRRATERHPDDAAAWLGLSELLAAQARAEEAAAVAVEAAALHPEDPGIVARSAELLMARGELPGAEAAARRAVALAPQDEAGHLLLADVVWRQHRGRDALRAVEAGLEAVPDSMAIRLRLGFLQLMQNAPLPAIAAFRAVTRRPNAPPEAWLGLTDALWRITRVEEATAAAREAVAAHPRHVDLRARLGQLLLAGGDADAARGAMAAVEADGPASEVVHLAMADALWRQGRRAEALVAAREVAEAAPDQPSVAARLGHLLLENGDIDEAVLQFERAIALQPGLIPAWTGLCDAERTRKRIKPAIAAYRRAEALGMDRMTRRMLRFRLFGELEE
jgi:tetratricopeptide (TPR) repeat protein